MANIFGNKILWGSDLYKGFKIDKKKMAGMQIDDLLPFQMLTQEEKSIDWIQAVADFYEVAGWSNVEKKASKIQRNYKMRYGKLNPNDYIVSPDNPYSRVLQMPVFETTSPLEQFYPLAPNFVDVLRGEFLKRDNNWTIEAVDQFSQDEMFAFKKDEFKSILMQQAAVEKQKALADMGITEEMNPEEYNTQMQQAMMQMKEVEIKSKGFRTTGVKWAEKVVKIHEKRYNLQEIEPDAFECGLITDSEYWHIDLLDDDFRLELINPMYEDHHKGPNVKYVSNGDYFLWFDFMSAGDIVNKFGRRMKEADILKLKEVYITTARMIMPDYMKSHQGAYYDPTKSWAEATSLDPQMNDTVLGQELAYSFTRSPNFDHNLDVDILNPVWGRRITGHPQMFRVMRLYWRSMKRIGWLTKINRDGSRVEPTWIDENYKVTIEPVYDTSVVKEKTKDNLLYGEHVDWTWAPDWRHVIKISPNQVHSFWNIGNMDNFEAIYLDGGPVKFQFKGRNNPFDSLPPIEGCHFSYINTDPHSFIDRVRPIQILYNICMNKVPKKFLKDYGNKVMIPNTALKTANMSNNTNGLDPHSEYEDRLAESDIFTYSYDREDLRQMGQAPIPTVLPLSTVQEAQLYFSLGQQIKWEAGELIGISRQRLGGQKASETKYGIEQGIIYSETQTEKYYEQHANLMERVRQRMLDATQYYSTFNENNRQVYLTDMDENAFLDTEGMDNTLAYYNIYLQSRANVRNALNEITMFLKQENTLPIQPSKKLEALIESSIPKILSLVREGELEQVRIEQSNAEREQQQWMADIQSKERMQSEKIAHDDMNAEKDRQNAVEVATIKALGGIQTDADSSGELDAQQNLENNFRQQEIGNKVQTEREKIAQKKQSDLDKNMLDREKSQNEITKEKIKQKGALDVAKENRTNAELKKKQSKSK